MKFPPLLITLLAITSSVARALPAETNKDEAQKKENLKTEDKQVDFINFINDDTLHGSFLGFTTSGKIIWKNPAAEKNIAFTPDQVRMVVLNNGKLVKPFSHSSYITLTNQDTIPGNITDLNNKTLTIRTDYAGELIIPREIIKSVDFLPLGNKIHYRGPFSIDDWQTYPYSSSATTQKDDEDSEPAWSIKNFALKNDGQAGVMMHNDDFPGKNRYTFKVTYRNSAMPSFVINADMKQPEPKEQENKPDAKIKAEAQPKIKIVSNRGAKITETVGTCLIFRLSSYSSSLSFYGFDDKGNSFVQSIPNTIPSVRSNKSKPDGVDFDVRVNKETNTVLLYADDSMIGQWDISAYTDQLKGNKMGFVNLYSSSANASRVSNIVVSAWNGIVDAANTMENDDRDTILLTNGTDRYSGQALKLSEDKLQLKGPYAELEIPTDQIQSLYFAKKERRELPMKGESEISLRFHGSGRITGSMSKGPDGKIILNSEVLGKLTILPEYVSSYEFEDLDYAYEIHK